MRSGKLEQQDEEKSTNQAKQTNKKENKMHKAEKGKNPEMVVL